MNPNLPQPSELPRERCLENGPECLSLRECLALILGSGPPRVGALGLAEKIVERPGDGLATQEQERAFFAAMEIQGQGHLQDISGIGPAARAKILAAMELAKRYAHYRARNLAPQPFETDSSRGAPLRKLAFEALSKVHVRLRTHPQEWLGFVPVYSAGQVGELCLVERGVRTHVNVQPSELFARVLALRPRGFFMFHNHPGGTLVASYPDQHLTDQVHQTANQLGLEFLGHWIVTSQSEIEI